MAEASLLAVIRPAVTMPVADLTLCSGPPLFSRHVKLKGEHLLMRHYALLPTGARQCLAADMALLYAQLHGLGAREMEAAGAGPIEPWLQPEDILRRTWPLLPSRLRLYADQTIAAGQQLPPDPYKTTHGFFDRHGWKIAFDHARNRLNGTYDFADSGFGPLHQELIYPNWIPPDLTARIVAEYEVLTGLALDRERIDLLSRVLRLSELAAPLVGKERDATMGGQAPNISSNGTRSGSSPILPFAPHGANLPGAKPMAASTFPTSPLPDAENRAEHVPWIERRDVLGSGNQGQASTNQIKGEA